MSQAERRRKRPRLGPSGASGRDWDRAAQAAATGTEAAQAAATGTEAAQAAATGTEAAQGRAAAKLADSARVMGFAEHSLIIKEAGTPAGTATLLHAGEPLELPDLAEVQRAVVMQKLRRMAERGGVRDAFGARGGSRGKGGKLGRLDAAWSAEELQERAEHARRRSELERSALVELGLAHQGVELRIGAARLNLQQSVRALRYTLDPETGQLRAEGIVR